jgi:hypothetical protein
LRKPFFVGDALPVVLGLAQVALSEFGALLTHTQTQTHGYQSRFTDASPTSL